jgi:hypothetical protein
MSSSPDQQQQAEQEPAKVYDKSNHIATGGIISGEMTVVHEKIAGRLAEKKSREE